MPRSNSNNTGSSTISAAASVDSERRVFSVQSSNIPSVTPEPPQFFGRSSSCRVKPFLAMEPESDDDLPPLIGEDPAAQGLGQLMAYRFWH